MRLSQSSPRSAMLPGSPWHRSVAVVAAALLAFVSSVAFAPGAGAVSPPTVTIATPVDGATIDLGTVATFAGTSIDDLDGDISADMVWSSDIDGALGTGSSIDATLVTAGIHTITATSTDTDLNTGSATVTVTAADLSAPVVEITSPTDGLRVPDGVATTFTATALDTVDGDLAASLVWTSDIDGSLGTGATVATTLTAGTHSITASVDDAAGNTGATTIAVEVVTTADPVVTVITPATGSIVDIGSVVTLEAVALDLVDGDLSAGIAWSSDLDGSLGVGTPVSTTLTAGTHTITATATDTDTNVGVRSTVVTVSDLTPPVVTISTPSDGATFLPGSVVALAGTAVDAVDGDLAASLAWTSDVDGSLGTGSSLSFALSTGTHVITATAIDGAGNVGTATITVTLADTTAPVVTITAPVDGTTVDLGDSLTFTGTAVDAVEGDLSDSIAWTSSLDGALATGETVGVFLTTLGTHTITATAIDGSANAGAASITVTVVDVGAPTLTIDAPSDGSTVLPGDEVTFQGTAVDVVDGDLSAQISWSSSLDGALGTGSSITTTTLSAGTHTIVASVTDTAGNPTTASITLDVADIVEPVVIVTSPADGVSVEPNVALSFVGSATDNADGDLSSQIQWSSDLDGLLGTGGVVSSSLTAGTHTITATAIDLAGNTGTVSLTVTAVDTVAPAVAIANPVDGAIIAPGTAAQLAGTAIDLTDGQLGGSILWTSDVDGALGSGTSVDAVLSTGPHTITATVTDAAGNIGSDAITVTVADVGQPVVTIASPANGSTVGPGTTITLLGSAVDDVDGSISSVLTWSSDLDGALGSGASVAATLSAGTHTITASATDGAGNTGTSSITVVVDDGVAPVVTIVSPAGGAVFTGGDSVRLSASAVDAIDGGLSGSIVWTSNIDGALGTGASFVVTTLSAGNHILTASATDLAGNTGTHTVAISVVSAEEPVVTIFSPLDGSTRAASASITLAAAADDVADGDISGSIVWTSDIDGALGTGAVITTNSLSIGLHTITASATDSDTNIGMSSVTLTIQDLTAPAVIISEPATGLTIDPGQALQFAAVAIDGVDGDVSSSLSWFSSLQGGLGAGASVTANLVIGTHVITASVADSSGNTGSASVSVTVADLTAPTVSITAPDTGLTVTPATSITFLASATDDIDGNLSTQIAWASDIDGPLGIGAQVNATLSTGVHLVSASVSDAAGNVSTAAVSVTVADAGAPIVTVVSPGDATNKEPGANVWLIATATDDTDGDLSSQIAWTSDVDGPLGTGGTVVVNSLSIGTHILTASATDSAGNTGADSVTITVSDITPPNTRIVQPGDLQTSAPGSSVVFAGRAWDTVDGQLADTIAWSSDIDGALGTGRSVSAAALSPGVHTITASATDAAGNNQMASITHTVADAVMPVVSILTPADGSTVSFGDATAFVGSAADAIDGDLSDQIVWTSDLAGAFGTGSSVSVSSFEIGTHTITATVVDSSGNTGSASLTVLVTDTGAPDITIVSPADGSSAGFGTELTLDATAVDAVDGDVSASVTWSSDLAGSLRAGTVVIDSLTVGTHVLTATAADSIGNVGTDSVTITVTDAVQEFEFKALPAQTAQVDDRVRAIAVGPPGTPAEGTVYFGGHFLNSQLPGATATDPTSPQAYAAAIDIATGQLTGWSPQFDGRIWTMEFSPDGSVLYVGGQFDNVDGIKNKKMAAFDTATGNLIPTFDASFNSDVVDIAVAPDGSRLYVAGRFKWTKGINQEYFAAINPTTGAVIQSFAPDVVQVAGPTPPRFDPEGASIELSADGSTVYLGGHFGAVNGVNRNNVAAVDALTGTTTLPFNPSVFSPNPNNPNQKNIIYEIVVPPAESPLDGTIWFCGDFYSVGIAISPNIVAVDAVTGAVPPVWTGGTDGGTPACMLDGDTLWLGGHFLSAGAPDSFVDGELRNHIANVSAVTGQALDYETFVDSPLGIHGMDIEDTSRGRNIWIGGDFDLIDGQRQARIAVLEESGTFPIDFSGDGSATGDNFDVYNVEVTETGVMTIDLDWVNPATEMWLFLVDPNGVTVVAERDTDKPQQASWVVDPGSWQILVKHQVGDGPYSMTVDVDTQVEAPDYLFTGSGTATGTSWFVHDFDVIAGDVITVDIDWTGGGQTNLFLYDDTGALVELDNTTAPSPKTLTATAASGGTWSIGIKIKTGGGDYSASVTLD